MVIWLETIFSSTQTAAILSDKDIKITNMDVYLDGEKVETRGEFVSEGVETHFDIDNVDCYIRSVSSGNKHKGLNYTLVVDDSDELPPTDNDFVESFPI